MSRISLNSNPSGTGTLSISSPNTNSDRTINLPDASGTVQLEGAAVNIGGNNISAVNSLGFRNRIINGDMRIDQRNAGAAVTTYFDYPVDRFQVARGAGTENATFSAQRSTDAPSGGSFTNSLQFTVTAAETSIAADERVDIRQRIEGFNFADLGFGVAGASPVTLSFWVRSSLTGTFGGALQNAASNRSYPYTYTISAANTWEYKTVAITGDTTGTWVKDNGNGLTVFWSLGAGTNRVGTAGAWNSNNNTGATGQVQLISTNGATWQVTGVQLEAGSVATPFERRDYGRELMMCQRYLKKVLSGKTGTGGIISSGAQLSTTGAFLGYVCNPPMRAAPTVTYDNLIVSDGVSFDSTVTSFVVEATSDCIYLIPNFSASGAQFRPVHLRAISSTTGSISFSSEL
jgi:hypothetical protein